MVDPALASALPPFLAKQHVLFNLRHAKFLPTPYQAEDSNRSVLFLVLSSTHSRNLPRNRMTLAYFCLSSLALLPSSAVSTADSSLSALEVMLKPAQKEGFASWVNEQQLPTGGFRGSDALSSGKGCMLPFLLLFFLVNTHQLSHSSGEASSTPSSDPAPSPSSSTSFSSPPTSSFSFLCFPHIIQSYTALLILALLDDDFSRLNRRGLLDFIGACQNADRSSLSSFGLNRQSNTECSSLLTASPTSRAAAKILILARPTPPSPSLRCLTTGVPSMLTAVLTSLTAVEYASISLLECFSF
jgi:geranylgeranyl transferase type-1 subunit beta